VVRSPVPRTPMQKRSTNLGTILEEMGRLTPEEVQQALRFQRENGGFFGEALVALGLLRPEEVRFALADQYDLPVVHLTPDAIDATVARLVPAAWARRHRLVPVLRDGDTVTVLVEVPPTAEQTEDVLRLVGAARIEPAISTAEAIDALIDAAHGTGHTPDPRLGAWLAGAIGSGADRLGISARPGGAVGWYEAYGAPTEPVGLPNGWQTELAALLHPVEAPHGSGVRRWPALLSVGEERWWVECGVVGAGAATELVLGAVTRVPGPAVAAAQELLGAVAERDGVLAVRATTSGAPQALEVLLPSLPQLLLGSGARSVHVADRPVAVLPGQVAVPAAGALSDVLDSLTPFRLDALTLDVARLDPDDLPLARQAAPLVVFREAAASTRRLRCDLHVRLETGGTPCWRIAD
jgi:type IV pilus assembly protein PilB